jgi:hypothetical protein
MAIHDYKPNTSLEQLPSDDLIRAVVPPELPSSPFFDKANREHLRGRVSASQWLERINLAYPPSSARGRSGCAAARVPERGRAPSGLSNAPYLHAHSIKVADVLIRPASVTFRLSHARKYGDYDVGHTSAKRRAKRGRVREFSSKSRLGLQLLAADLQAVVKKPDLMITLTYPGQWRSATTDWSCRCEVSQGCSDVPCICDFSPSGKTCKKHLRAFRERLARYLKDCGLSWWGALWFLEFQTRGAPHFHLLLFGFGFSLLELSNVQRWCSRSWSEIVNHSDPEQRRKHRLAGTRVERCRAEHFGYALKYAAKLEQKSVPLEFANIGRFWGVWNTPLSTPALRSWYISAAGLKKIGVHVYNMLIGYSVPFAGKFATSCHAAADGPYTFTHRVFGVELSKYFAEYGLPSGP